jgi:hypothetical protein
VNVALSYVNKFTFYQACSSFYLVQVTSAKFDLHAGKMKFNPQIENDKYAYNQPIPVAAPSKP